MSSENPREQHLEPELVCPSQDCCLGCSPVVELGFSIPKVGDLSVCLLMLHAFLEPFIHMSHGSPLITGSKIGVFVSYWVWQITNLKHIELQTKIIH
jgi:hypothetical protein